MKWAILIGESLLYLWGIYTLSFNPDSFPDPAYAHRQWDKRAMQLAWLGSAMFTTAVLFVGLIHHWWAVLLVFMGSVLLVMLVQPGFVGLIILGRTGKTLLRMKFGLKTGSPWLAPFAWSYFPTGSEKRAAKTDN